MQFIHTKEKVYNYINKFSSPAIAEKHILGLSCKEKASFLTAYLLDLNGEDVSDFLYRPILKNIGDPNFDEELEVQFDEMVLNLSENVKDEKIMVFSSDIIDDMFSQIENTVYEMFFSIVDELEERRYNNDYDEFEVDPLDLEKDNFLSYAV